ncbi:SDR family NAD(P)-dependent oxidoreductase [Ralstonia solanacearum]|uniref:SDR family NAD(P)-dependent oxidoreductase n=2 Tax=Ralstonia solanacearum TaxID=305 RepID=A0AAW5ZXF7_RALSL|nr:SDR family NAD(P)-dependent oxidoreductase [Ralstonia solanacearum]MDB0573913.1 SDR family NAD(P)-dependent oxidoreductase [Ralstonia solanacearum]
MTGATAGLGEHAAKLIAAVPTSRVIIGARGGRSGPEGTESLPLDLNSLDSVRTFAEAVRERLGGAPIDMLVLNAGLQFSNAEQRSADGFEATFAVNHLAHYLLARLLLPNIAEGGRLVITTSDTHDPAIIPMAPKTLVPQALAYPGRGGTTSGFHAYSSSKLCNLLTARSFAARDDVCQRHIRIIAYNPGLTLGTSLSRTAPSWVGGLMTSSPVRGILRFASRFKSALYPGTPERAGEVLAALALGTVEPPPGRVYASLVRSELTFPDPSKLAQSDEARDRLWRESATMVGL